MSQAIKIGTFGWVDLTVEDADTLRDFYCDVAGWTASPVDMGGYSDYSMITPDGTAVGGVCHARGTNADQPPVWMVYVVVEDLDRSLASCKARGGELVAGPKKMGEARYAIIRDPAGAVCGLYQEG